MYSINHGQEVYTPIYTGLCDNPPEPPQGNSTSKLQNTEGVARYVIGHGSFDNESTKVQTLGSSVDDIYVVCARGFEIANERVTESIRKTDGVTESESYLLASSSLL